MKKLFHPTNLPLWVFITGGIGLLLRVWLLTSGIDQNGFIIPGHFAIIALLILVAGVLTGLFFLTRNLVEAEKYSFNFPASNVSSIGTFIAAAGIGLTSFAEVFTAGDTIEMLVAVLGLGATLLLVLIGYYRRLGTQPSLLLHLGLCVYLMIRLIGYYRHWSSDPQILDYCFQLIAVAFLMLATYQRATFDIDSGKRRPHAFFSLAAIFFSCLSLVGWNNIAFFLSTLVWQITDLCSLIPLELDESYFDEYEYEDDEW